MASVGGAAAQGLQAGFGMGMQWNEAEARKKREQRIEDQATEERGLRLQDRATAAEDRTYTLGRQKVADARLVQQDQRQADSDAESAAEKDLRATESEGAGYFAQYGDHSKVPPEVWQPYAERVGQARSRLTELRAKRYAPLIEKERKESAELWSKVQTGQISIDDVPDDQLVKSLTAQTRRDIGDFLPSKAGGPSKVQQAGMDFMVGMETGNDDLTTSALSTLFAPELRIGVGGSGRDGSTIVSKEIAQLVPHPGDPQQVVPMVKVTVRREDGKVGSYIAPITEDRSADPQDNVKAISMQDGMERVGQLTTLAQTLSQRGIVERIANGRKTAGDAPKNFLEAFYASGGKVPAKKITYSQSGGKGAAPQFLIGRDETGQEVSREVQEYVPIPKQGGSGSGSGEGDGNLGAKSRGIDAAFRRGEIDEETRKSLHLQNLGGEKTVKLKDTPPTVQKGMLENDSNLRNLDHAIGLIEGKGKDATGVVLGRLPQWAQNKWDTAGTTTRAAIADIGSLKIHDRSGAAVTAAEFPRLAPFIPVATDTPEVVAKKLKRFKEIVRAEQDVLQETYAEDNGYRPFKVKGSKPLQDEPSVPTAPAPTQQRGMNPIRPGIDLGPSSVPSRQQAAPNTAPVRLTAENADAEFAKLPSGATFIAPDGSTRRKP